MRGKFFITDVFGQEKYSGNQLATFIDCQAFSGGEMLQIAREFNFAETTFIVSDLDPVNSGYDVRIFTPESEIDFAGHPTLGTAFIISHFLQKKVTEVVRLNLRVGQIPVQTPLRNLSEPLWMTQIEPSFGKTFTPEFLSPILSLPESAFHETLPIQEVSTGLPFLIVPLKSLDFLKKAFVDMRRYPEFLKKTTAKGILIFCSPGYCQDETMAVRVFVPCLGVPEDPATGSANGCLTGYLLKNGHVNQELQATVGQGHEIGRPSKLYLRGKVINGKINIQVGGKVVLIAQGEWC